MESQDRSLDELLEVAKRAQSIIAHLDLDAVARHDPGEVEKLGRVTDAMSALDQGEQVDYVPGVDDDDAAGPPLLDPHQVRRSELLELLDQAGLSERTGRVFVCDADTATKPLEAIPHQDGIPRFDVCIAPEYAPTHGAHGIFVSERGVFSVMVVAPVMENRWRILRSMPYDTQSEMIDIIKRYVVRPST